MVNSNTQKLDGIETYFKQNSKFFGSGDSNGKKAFFVLGHCCKKVMDCQEKDGCLTRNSKRN